ncbi:hypothetical protein GJ496_008825 [Pomphorhynchus laevis]|nr:hypothetical protein GJ496_008825 [Pomphorhynchus laevis]
MIGLCQFRSKIHKQHLETMIDARQHSNSTSTDIRREISSSMSSSSNSNVYNDLATDSAYPPSIKSFEYAQSARPLMVNELTVYNEDLHHRSVSVNSFSNQLQQYQNGPEDLTYVSVFNHRPHSDSLHNLLQLCTVEHQLNAINNETSTASRSNIVTSDNVSLSNISLSSLRSFSCAIPATTTSNINNERSTESAENNLGNIHNGSRAAFMFGSYYSRLNYEDSESGIVVEDGCQSSISTHNNATVDSVSSDGNVTGTGL